MPACTFLSHPQSRDSGDYQHRVALPAQALARHWSVDDLLTSHPRHVQRALAADLLVICMVAEPAIGRLIQARRATGRPTVYEISDDFEHFPSSLPGHAFYSLPQTRSLIQEFAREATLLQFSSHGLQQTYGHLNDRQAVFVNHLGELPALSPRGLGEGGRPVLGWAGSAGHADDALRLAGRLMAWARRRQAAGQGLPLLRLMAAPVVARLFDGCGLRTELHPTGDFARYLAFLSDLDVGFACIGEDRFSVGRSDGKFIEMASRGVVCMASDQGEYRHSVRDGHNGFLYADQSGFDRALDTLVDDEDARLRLRSAAYDYVARERLHARAVQERLEVYAALVGDPAVDAGGGHGVRAAVPEPDAAMDRAIEERVLCAALRHREGRHDIALDLYVACMQDAPDFYLPWERAALIARSLGSEQESEFLAVLARRKLQHALQAQGVHGAVASAAPAAA